MVSICLNRILPIDKKAVSEPEKNAEAISNMIKTAASTNKSHLSRVNFLLLILFVRFHLPFSRRRRLLCELLSPS